MAVPAADNRCHTAGTPGWAEERQDACTRPGAADHSQGSRDAGRAEEGDLRLEIAAAGKTASSLETVAEDRSSAARWHWEVA